MVAIKALFIAAFIGFVAAHPEVEVEEVEERGAGMLGMNLPTWSGKNFEYSLHSSKTNKHIGSCHIYLQTDTYPTYPSSPLFTCSKKTRKCKATGPGAKQAFINDCNAISLGAAAMYIPDGYN